MARFNTASTLSAPAPRTTSQERKTRSTNGATSDNPTSVLRVKAPVKVSAIRGHKGHHHGGRQEDRDDPGQKAREQKHAPVVFQARHKGRVRRRKRNSQVGEETHGVLQVPEFPSARIEESETHHEPGQRARHEVHVGEQFEGGIAGRADDRNGCHECSSWICLALLLGLCILRCGGSASGYREPPRCGRTDRPLEVAGGR